MVRARAIIVAFIAVVLANCSGFQATEECDPGDSRACETQCGPGTQRCESGGTWGICQPDEEPECTPGEYGSCDLEAEAPPGLWFCSDDCRIGPCLPLCLPGETWECEAQCGPGEMRCQDDGSWGLCLEYIIPSCRLGDIERCPDDEGHRRCTEECYFGPCDDGPCSSGEVAECGICASQVCLADETWSECTAYSSAVCSPGEVEDCEAPCGPGQRTCTDICEWTECLEIDSVSCHPGDRQLCPTTLYCGLAFRICNVACEWSDCIETGD